MPHPRQSPEKSPPYTEFRSALKFCQVDCSTLPGKLIDILNVICKEYDGR